MMTKPYLWTDAIVPLQNLAATLGFDSNDLQLNESPYELNYTNEQFEAANLVFSEDEQERAKQLDNLHETLQSLREHYGRSVTFRISIGQYAILTLDSEYDRSKLDQFYETSKRSPILVLYLRIDKAELASYWSLTHASAGSRIFLFHEPLVRALTVPLSELEGNASGLLKDSDGEHKVFIFLPEYTIELNGDYLAVLGGKAMERWTECLSSKGSREEVRFVSEQAKENLKWESIELDLITPLQLFVDWQRDQDGKSGGPSSDDPIASALYAQLVACSILYMAARSKFDRQRDANAQSDSTWVATFAADKYVARFEMGRTSSIAATLKTHSTVNVWETAQTIGNLAKWIYKERRGVVNRLNVVQVVIASALQDNDASVNLSELVRRAPELLERVERRWDAFMDERLDQYFLKIKELEDIVETTTKSYSEQVQFLTKALTDNMLAAVAVIVGSFVAAILKSPFEPYIFLFGTGVYVIYLVIFPIGVGLTSALQRFNDSRSAFLEREQEFSNRLSPPEVAQIVGPAVATSERRFRFWFRSTLILYIVVALLVVAAMFTVPSKIKSWTDDFRLTGLSYEDPATSEVVPLKIRGENFDKDKEIVVSMGDSRFTNTYGQTLKVHGSTVLTLLIGQTDLQAAKLKGSGFVLVQQGSAQTKGLPLPSGLAPIPRPLFQTWSLASASNGRVIQAYGTDFGSIFEVEFNNAKLNFKVLDNGTKLELSDPKSLKGVGIGKSLEVTLKNGEKMRQVIANK